MSISSVTNTLWRGASSTLHVMQGTFNAGISHLTRGSFFILTAATQLFVASAEDDSGASKSFAPLFLGAGALSAFIFLLGYFCIQLTWPRQRDGGTLSRVGSSVLSFLAYALLANTFIHTDRQAKFWGAGTGPVVSLPFILDHFFNCRPAIEPPEEENQPYFAIPGLVGHS